MRLRYGGTIQRLFKRIVLRVRTQEKVVYLTFDDGPIPEVTPWVLDTLRAYNAKATFFCLGRNIERNPELFARLKSEGHAIGNHSWGHPNGWTTRRFRYLRDVLRGQAHTGTSLFRPPYGRLTLGQARALTKRFTVVLWDVLSQDFDLRLSGEEVLKVVKDNTREGSIVVFHDSLLAEERLRVALPRTLEHFAALGYRFPVLSGGTVV